MVFGAYQARYCIAALLFFSTLVAFDMGIHWFWHMDRDEDTWLCGSYASSFLDGVISLPLFTRMASMEV